MAYQRKTKRTRKPDTSLIKNHFAPTDRAYKKVQEWLIQYDLVISDAELRWGVDRLPFLVSAELRDRFMAQMDKMNAAIDRVDPIAVEEEVQTTIRGIKALERAAVLAGAKELTGEHWEAAMPDGKVLAIAKTDVEVSRVQKDNRDMIVYSVAEIGRIIGAWRDNEEAKTLDAIKRTFDGAVVESVTKQKTITEAQLNDEIPF
jgi:hypothetical protein